MPPPTTITSTSISRSILNVGVDAEADQLGKVLHVSLSRCHDMNPSKRLATMTHEYPRSDSGTPYMARPTQRSKAELFVVEAPS